MQRLYVHQEVLSKKQSLVGASDLKANEDWVNLLFLWTSTGLRNSELTGLRPAADSYAENFWIKEKYSGIPMIILKGKVTPSAAER